MQDRTTISLETTLAGLTLHSPIYNASGVWCTTAKELDALLTCPYAGAVVTKSCTLLARDGNLRPRYQGIRAQNLLGSINSMGLANHGIEYYLESARQLAAKAPFTKPYFVSVSGLSKTENMQILSAIQYDAHASPISGVELNLSCPNVVGKPQTGYDFEALDETLRYTFELFDRYPLGLKMPPYFDIAHFDAVADILKGYPRVRWLTCINSMGNALVVNSMLETTVITPKGGFGGLGGTYVKPTALANVRAFRERLPASVDLVGCGGVVRGVDAFEHILCGATAVQVGTALMELGTPTLHTIQEELGKIMLAKGYKSLSDFRGKLRALEPSLSGY
jgi:dihydroorotate dehydrogenase (fumarate)